MTTALLERWPRVDLPRVALGTWPTPLRPLAVPGLPDGLLLVKDEGLAGEGYGGNKVRKLEYLLADARERGAGDVVTTGAVGSHHVVATAVYARRLGMRPYAVLVPQPDDPHVRESARLIDAFCEGWFAAPSYAAVPWAWTRAWAAIRVVGGVQPYRIPIGGSCALGTVGEVAAGLEIADQCRQRGQVPERVYVALGSGGTAAGIWIGLRLAGLETEVVAVRVADRALTGAGRVRRLARRALTLLEARGVPVGAVRLEGLRVVHDWFAGGYGVADDRVRALVRRGAELDLPLDPTYTAKALGACLEELSESPVPSVFVGTLNRWPLDDLLAEAVPDVPEVLAGLLR